MKMRDLHRPQCSWFLCFLGVLAAISRAEAQDNPADSGRTPAASPTGDTEPAPTSEAAPPETDPLVLAILEVKPTTAEAWLQDARALIQLNRPQLAKTYLSQLAAALPNDEELARWQSRWGSAFFLQLARDAALQPEGGTVAEAVMRAAAAHVGDAQRLENLVERLTDDGERAAARRLASAELVQAGAAAVSPLLRALMDTSRAGAHASVRQTLVAIGDGAVAPLLAALQAPTTEARVAASDLLTRLKSAAAIPYLVVPALSDQGDAFERETARRALVELVGQVPARDEALDLLTHQRDTWLAGTPVGPVDEQQQVTLWAWDAAQQMPVTRTWPSADASLWKGAEFAHLAHRLAPEIAAHRVLYLAAALEVAQREAGYDRLLLPADAPIVSEATAAGAEMLEQVLVLALDRQWYGAAMIALDLLGATQDVGLLHSADGQPRWLVRALVSPHRRVQFAAVRAIMQLDPRSGYPGSSFLPELLAHMALSAGRPRVLLGDPRREVARTLAGHFDALGFDATTVSTGRDFLLQAGASPDYVALLIADSIDRPDFRELVQVLRHDHRTADLPIGILVREGNARAARRFAESDALTLDFPPPQNREDVVADLERLLQAAGRQLMSADERQRHAVFALDALAKLAEDTDAYGFYDLMRLEDRLLQALATGASPVPTTRVLGLLGSPGAQQSLVEFASAREQPLAARQAAADALRVAVNRRGLLLTRSRLQQQYDLYNESEVLDRGTQAVLASILDTVEAQARKDRAAPQDD